MLPRVMASRKRYSRCRQLGLAAACCLLLWGVGCKRSSDGLTPEQRQSGDRLSQIAKRTDGDWSKLTQEERTFIVKELAYGNEQSARMLLLAAAGKIGGRPGGPPRR